VVDRQRLAVQQALLELRGVEQLRSGVAEMREHSRAGLGEVLCIAPRHWVRRRAPELAKWPNDSERAQAHQTDRLL